ncbi:MAG TPA: hypothetical protein VLR94_04020 [Acidobacteriota bacterium]|nr:hypothetical protein [Acidobacteriota bacterium]
MSSRSSSSSCFGTALLIVVGLILIRFGLPELWLILARLFSTAFYGGVALVLVALLALGFFTYRNLQRSKEKEAPPAQVSRVVRVQELYKSLTEQLQRESVSNEVSAEEFLQSEILVSQTLNDLKIDLIRLKDFVSPKNEESLARQLRDYRQELLETTDPSVKQVIQENLKMLEEKKERIAQTHEEIRQKEASVDLVYHSLVKAEEDLKLGKTVRHLLPAEVYQRFGLTAPREREPLPPLTENSSGTN